jgi:hypothetical protein
MTLQAPQWGGELTANGPGTATDPPKTSIRNGAEFLFLAARDYGIRVCFANPGMYTTV